MQEKFELTLGNFSKPCEDFENCFSYGFSLKDRMTQ
jgi:hypothetical protein